MYRVDGPIDFPGLRIASRPLVVEVAERVGFLAGYGFILGPLVVGPLLAGEAYRVKIFHLNV